MIGDMTDARALPTDLRGLLRWSIDVTVATAKEPLGFEQALAIGVTLTTPLMPIWSAAYPDDARVPSALRLAQEAVATGVIAPEAEAAGGAAFDAAEAQSTQLLARVAKAAGHCASIAAGFVGELPDVLEAAIFAAMAREGLSESEAVERTAAVVREIMST